MIEIYPEYTALENIILTLTVVYAAIKLYEDFVKIIKHITKGNIKNNIRLKFSNKYRNWYDRQV